MNATNDPLWLKLEAFTFDHQDALTFTQRLARENNWSAEFARRVVDEYRRFLFLALRAGHPVTPSDEVDQAWHLHLVYTRSYWEELCQGVLERPLHHGPTRGGKAEDDHFERQYVQTQASYARWFGQAPPADIWPPAKARFSPHARFTRVNTAAFWMLPKQRVHRLAAACLLAWLTLTTLAACATQMGGVSFGDVFPFLVLLVVIGLAIWAAKRRGGGGSGCGSSCGSGGSGCSSHHNSSSGDSSHHGGSSDCSSHSDGSSGCSSSGCGGGGCGGGCGGGGGGGD